ncbi:MAG: hypothetical protein ABSH48_17170 [Verrucomicrobiota bacterium]
MNKELTNFASRLSRLINAYHVDSVITGPTWEPVGRSEGTVFEARGTSPLPSPHFAPQTPQNAERVKRSQHRVAAKISAGFESLATELFALQFHLNPAYRKICEARQLSPQTVGNWKQIPPVPTGAFKELELSCIPPAELTAVFHSSGTTGQKPSRHFHCAESLALYEASLWHSFRPHFNAENEFLFLTPDQAATPRSSLVHMFETVSRAGTFVNRGAFCGSVAADGSWIVDFERAVQRLNFAAAHRRPLTLLGTAFSFVHLLDFLAENGLRFILPEGSQVMETGGYKNRSRVLPKAELHALIADQLGVGRENIICEYGMSELSSQAYDSASERRSPTRLDANVLKRAGSETGAPADRHFHFPPWARAQIISTETGREAADGETGLIRILDLANVYSVAAVQTEDLGVRDGDGFELIGRAELAEPRGCSLMAA